MKNYILSLFLLTSCFPLLSYENWFISAKLAINKQKTPDTIWLDTRDKSKFNSSHISGAFSLTWEELSLPDLPNKGNLLPQDQLVDKIQALGISNNSLVLIYGSGRDGWGEEGRVAWSFRSMGHKKTFIVDGGYSLLKELGAKTSNFPKEKLSKSMFIPTKKLLFTINKEEILHSLRKGDYAFIDTRENREFIGGVPYGEARGGHLPGAKNIHFKEFLSQNGEILKPNEIQTLLISKGIDISKPIVSYCTGGVRSGLVTSILQSYGYRAMNYPGSMWEWSHLPEKLYPLVRGVN